MSEHYEGNGDTPRQKFLLFLAGVLGLLLLAGFVLALVYLLNAGPPLTETLRDVVIILVAFEFMVIGLALVILIVQLAKLVNLLQNEVRPILESTSEAAHTLRGTARFLSNNLVGPVMKANGAIAALRRAADLLNLGRRRN